MPVRTGPALKPAVKIGVTHLMPVALGVSSLFSSLSAHAGIQQISTAPLTKAQLEAVYQPVQPAQFATAVPRVNSVEWLLNQLKLADAVGRDDIVESTLERLFAIEENHPAGLYYEANMYLKRQQPEQAQQVYERLKKSAPRSSHTQALGVILALRGKDRLAYQHARLLAKSGRYQEALSAYNTLFPQGMPSPALQLEYLQLEGNLSSRWADVKRGLERLNADYPGVPQYQLALANHIMKENPADPWVLNTYRQLAFTPGLGTTVRNSWMRALDIVPISADVVKQYSLLASYFPSDMDLQRASQGAAKRWEIEQELRKDPTYLAKLRGLKLLDEGKNAQAEKQLRYALSTRPQDPDILGGLGLVYLRAGNQKQALNYFKQALVLNTNPDTQSKWENLVQTSSYWIYLDDGDKFAARGNFSKAEQRYKSAITIDQSGPYAFTSLGALYLQQGKYAAADRYYRMALERDKLNGSALRGRLDVLLEQDDAVGALKLAQRYTPAQQSVVADKMAAIQSDTILRNLRTAMANDDRAGTEKYLAALIEVNPTSPWLRLDIANVLLSLGERSRADARMKRWAAETSDPEMQFAYALYLADTDQPDAAIAVLERVPANNRTESMQRNLIRLQLNRDLTDLQKQYAISPSAVRETLHRLEKQFAGQVQPLSRIANAWVDVGHPQEAERIYRTLQPSGSWDADAHLAYGGLMVSLMHFADFDRWYNTLAPQLTTGKRSVSDKLSASEMRELDALQTRRWLAEANILLARHDAKRAFDGYEKASSEQEPYQTQGQIGMLLAAAELGDKARYPNVVAALDAKRHSLSARQLMAAATVLHRVGYQQKASEFNALLDSRSDADAMDYRDSMAIAMDNQQWNLAEMRAYQALNSDRIEKRKDTAVAKSETPTPRELYDTADDYWLTRNVKTDIDKLRDRTDGHILIGWDYSARDGENKSSQIPIEARIPVTQWEGHLLLRADYISVDSGELGYYDKKTDKDITRFHSKASGMALGVGWEAENWRADIGTTPLGFDHSTWVGGLSVDGDLGDIGWTATVSRRPETSSTLSYAGMTVPSEASDPAGTEWGGVVRTGVKFNASWDDGGPYGFWSSAQFHFMNGEKVTDNTRLGLLGGAYYKLIATDDRRLSVGTNLMYLSYDKNLSEYSLLHGGYYSPQSYFSISLPVNYYGRYDNTWSYLISGSVSNSWTQEDAPYLSSGQSDTGGGFGYSLQAALEKRVSERWYLGASFDLQRSDFYTPNHFMFYAKYTFNDRWQPIEFPPAVPKLYSDFD